MTVEADFTWPQRANVTRRVGFVTVVRMRRADTTAAVFAPLRFGEVSGRPFSTAADALMGGYSAAWKIVERRANASM